MHDTNAAGGEPALSTEPTFSFLEPQISLASVNGTSMTASGQQKASLRNRRSGQNSLVLTQMDMDTISSSSRDCSEIHEAKANFRGWWRPDNAPVAELLDPMRTNPAGLRVVSYNILAARFTSSDKYPHCPLWALAETYRLANIFRELQQMDAHIITLEELSTNALQSAELGLALKNAGYDHYFVPITTDKKERQTSNSGGSGMWGPSDRPEHEGVGIFWKRDRFLQVECHPLRFNAMIQRDPELSPDDRRRLTITTHNIANIVVLQDKLTEAHFVVGGIHGFFDFAKPDCQLWQVTKLIAAIEDLCSTYGDLGTVTPIIMGDFNCEPRGASVSYALTGHTQFTPHQLNATRASQHHLGLASAYTSYCDAHPTHITACAGGFAGTIDHIFFEGSAFECVAVAKLLGATDIPTAQIPSDHFPVCAWLIPRPPPAA